MLPSALHDASEVLVLSRSFPATAQSVALARGQLRDLVQQHRPGNWPHAELMLSELVSNAVRHGRGDRFVVRFRLDGDMLHVAVVCRGERFVAQAHRPHDDQLGGRGLMIVEQLADTWGVDHHAQLNTAWFACTPQ